MIRGPRAVEIMAKRFSEGAIGWIAQPALHHCSRWKRCLITILRPELNSASLECLLEVI